MNRIIFLIITLLFLNNCSLNKNSINSKKEFSKDQSIEKLFVDKKIFSQEFNPDLELKLNDIKSENKIVDNKNNYGFQKYDGLLEKIGSFKFSKLDGINQIHYKPLFLTKGLVFFNKKGSIIKYDDKGKIIWKKNHYSKPEKKLKPKLNLAINNNNLIVADSIAKYYLVNIENGELIWSKNNTYPFNSEIKIYKDKFFVVDYKNILRCYFINDGSECWNLQTEDSFTISDIKYSLIVINDLVIFSNSIGDITAVNTKTGLIKWQLPTQSSNIINETYNFKNSKLVSDGNSIFFSNNKNEFYSIDTKSGTINWINEINSNIKPVVSGNLIFSVSNEGYLFVIDKIKGNIVRITDLLKNYKVKKRKNIKPIGFAIGNTNLYLTNNDGKMTVVDLKLGKVINLEKVSGNLVSKPFIFNHSLFIVRNGSIIQYN